MNSKDFSNFLSIRIDKIKQSLYKKGEEYSTDDDKLHNFVRTSEMNRETVSRSCHGMMSKHLTSYLDMLDRIDKGEKISQDFIDEKFGDIINYFILQEAIIREYHILK